MRLLQTQTSTRKRTPRRAAYFLVLGAIACSAPPVDSTMNEPGGATSSSGGTVASGGSRTPTGGSLTNATGGVVSMGGTSSTGGNPSTGGTLSSGGSYPIATGGVASQTGGESSGGSATTGGSSPTGGNASGGIAKGGTTASGGATSGGAATGGGNTGGAGTGGARTGGAGTGGALASGGASQTGGAGTGGFPSLPASLTLHIAGDSTAAIFPASDSRVGWGAVFQQFFTTGVTVDDAARSGRSTKSYIDEGWWKTLKASISVGDYVFIEFGHNDEKSDQPALYTDPATTFQTNLKLFINDTRTAGGVPILLTPTSRAQFASDGTITPTHGAYPAAVIAVGKATQTPVIDMTEKTRIWLEALGPTAALPFFAPGDITHTSAKGAPEVGKLVVQGIRELGLPLAQRLAP